MQNHFLLTNTSKTTAFSSAVSALEKTQGYIVALSSMGAQLRFPGASDPCISKHAVNRLVEFIVLGKTPSRSSLPFWGSDTIDAEHPSVRAFALAPGQLPTRLAIDTGVVGDNCENATDSVALPAATMLYLTSGRADWLSGRFVHSSLAHHRFRFLCFVLSF